jgi:hypothetical protein
MNTKLKSTATDPLSAINGCKNPGDFLLTNWNDLLCCESRESGPASCTGLVFFSGLRQADLVRLTRVVYCLVPEGVIDL